STWRWQNKMGGLGIATGGAALLPLGNAGARQIALPTDAMPRPLFIFDADGSGPFFTNQNFAASISGPAAAGPSGNLYVMSPAAPGALNVVLPNLNVTNCGTRTGTTLGAPPVIVGTNESAVVVATARTDTLNQKNFIVYHVDAGGR